MPKHTLYFSDAAFKIISVAEDGPEGLSVRVSRLCAMAIEMMDDNIPVLLKSEWLALMDISNGQYFDTSTYTPRQAVNDFWFSINESGMECNEKWGVNCVKLSYKYRDLPLASKLAVIEVCRRFWTRKDVNSRYDNYGDIMRAHGAKFSDKTEVDSETKGN